MVVAVTGWKTPAGQKWSSKFTFTNPSRLAPAPDPPEAFSQCTSKCSVIQATLANPCLNCLAFNPWGISFYFVVAMGVARLSDFKVQKSADKGSFAFSEATATANGIGMQVVAG